MAHADRIGNAVPRSGWHSFWKAVGLTLLGFALIAAGFFGAMLVTGWLA